jgi:hypothetical protein
MNPTQIIEFVMNWINQKIIKFNQVPLSRNHAWPSRTTRARPACAARTTRGPWRERASAALLGEPTAARETVGNGGSPARRRRRGSQPAASEAVGAMAARERRSGGGRRERGRLSRHAARCPSDSYLGS